MSKPKNASLREWIEAFIVAGLIAIFARTFLFQIYKIPTTSMVPILMPGDKIFVSKITYGPKVPFTKLRIPGFRKPKRGEVIVFIPPEEAQKPWYSIKKHYIKRLIGLSSDEVMIKEGNIYVDEKQVLDPAISGNYYYNQGDYGRKGQNLIVPEGKYFFLGDNSVNSQDSRVWGFADEEEIIGKAIFIWWPPKRITMIE